VLPRFSATAARAAGAGDTGAERPSAPGARRKPTGRDRRATLRQGRRSSVSNPENASWSSPAMTSIVSTPGSTGRSPPPPSRWSWRT